MPDREALARYGLMVSDVQDVDRRPRSAARRSRRRSRAASATASTCAIRATCAAIRNRSRATCWWRCPAAARCRWARSRRSSSTRGPTIDPHRERPTRGLHLRRHPRPRSRRLRRRRQGGGRRQRAVSARIITSMWSGQYEYLERANARAEDRGAGDAADHLPAALPQFPPLDRDADRDAVAAVRAGRRPLADVVARLQLSVAVAVGFIALAGVAAETGVIMLIYLDQALQEIAGRARAEGAPFTRERPARRRSCWARSSACGRK